MMRSLWTAASGMISQQQNVDVISHNLANVNTFGYKKERLEFKTLLYESMNRADLDPANQTGRPVNLQVGHGVRPVATARIFSQGNLQRTDNSMDFAISGDGFFAVDRGGGDIQYTKDGAFKISATDEGSMLATADGYPILDVDGAAIVIPGDVSVKNVSVDETGLFAYTDASGVPQDLDLQIGLVQFSNPQGLEAAGANLLRQTAASGLPLSEAGGETNQLSSLQQGVLEMSNVQVAEEMVSLIVAQRAYDINSKAITTSDDMLQTANSLKR
ncbi:MAG: flagellar basal-body rod protein FlgG [Clostridiales bacterium]|nr:flagellar basal-body rod protein FlgG [Clostridiales bacterium]